MTIDLDALRRKHEELNNPGQSGSDSDFLNKFYQIPVGSNAIRILPWGDSEREFYAETKIHRVPMQENTTKNVHCRKIHGEACPLCDFYYSLWKTGRKEDEDLARQIKPRARYYLNILVRESEDVKILSIGIILFKKIINAILDPDFGDITDPEAGHDFKIVKIMEGKWPKYDQSQPRPKSSPLASSKQEVTAIMDSLHNIHALVKLEEYEDVKKITQSLVASSVKDTRSGETHEGGSSGDDYLTRLQS